MDAGNMETQRSKKQYSGFSMIEVLVTLGVLSVGLLGIASLQFISALSNSEALARSHAVMVAQQHAEKLRLSALMMAITDNERVNDAYTDNDNYNFAGFKCDSGALPYDCYCLKQPDDLPDCHAVKCSQSALARYDAYQSSCALVKDNPSGRLAVSCEDSVPGDDFACSGGSRYQIQVSWPATSWQAANRGDSHCDTQDSTALNCVNAEVTL